MTITDAVSLVNSPTTNQFNQAVEEISLTIAAQDLAPTMVSQDFLKLSGIVPQDWELAQQPVLNPNFAQLIFNNGVSINAQPRTITLNESLGNKKIEAITIHQIADKFLAQLPHAQYLGLSFNPKILIPFPSSPQIVRQYITESLLGSGAWKHIGKTPVQAGINLVYSLERCQMAISISEAKLQKPSENAIAAILFAGSFNYNVYLPQEQLASAISQMNEFLDHWQTDLEQFREIVNQKFLDSTQADETQTIGGISVFPGQTL